MARTYIISEICGDWALQIREPGHPHQFLYFNSENNADLVKSILEWEDAHPNEAVPYNPTLTPPNEPSLLEFDVVDTTTGKYPDWERIAREESWAKGLAYCDMDGIAIREDGSLILLDECGNCVSCPPDRFEIRRQPEGKDA